MNVRRISLKRRVSAALVCGTLFFGMAMQNPANAQSSSEGDGGEIVEAILSILQWAAENGYLEGSIHLGGNECRNYDRYFKTKHRLETAESGQDEDIFALRRFINASSMNRNCVRSISGDNADGGRRFRALVSRLDAYSSPGTTPSGTLSAGLYRFPDGTILSANDTGAFCTFVSPAHFEYLSGQSDRVRSINSSDLASVQSAMANHGACAVRLSAGAYRLVDGRIIASNGSAFCRYVSFDHYERKDGRPIRAFSGEIPLHAMENHFDCHQ